MSSKTPPPYFPQGSLAPSDPNRYRKFKLAVAAILFAVLLLLAGIGFAVYYLIRSVV